MRRPLRGWSHFEWRGLGLYGLGPDGAEQRLCEVHAEAGQFVVELRDPAGRLLETVCSARTFDEALGQAELAVLLNGGRLYLEAA